MCGGIVCNSKMDHTLLIHYFTLLLYEIGWFIVQNHFDFCKQNHYSFVDIHRFAKPTAPTWISQTMRKYSTWNMFRPNVVISAEFIRQFNMNLEQHHNQHTYHEWNNENRKHDRLSWLSFLQFSWTILTVLWQVLSMQMNHKCWNHIILNL